MYETKRRTPGNPTRAYATSTGLIRENGASSSVLDELFDVLADQNRRTALQYLLTRESGVEIDDLLDEVVSTEQVPGAENPRRRLHTRFVHVHLPKLADVGVVEYDTDTGIVEPTRMIHDIEPCLEWARSRDNQ